MAAPLAAREELIGRPGPFGPGRRAALTAATDGWLRTLFDAAAPGTRDVALIAVGSHGRAELAPGSDLDLVLVHRGDGDLAGGIAERIWYPVWDSGLRLDHSVRSVAEARRLASTDLKVLLGLLDARVIAGDEALRDQLVGSVLADWRAMASDRLPLLREMVDHRRSAFGDIATLLEPNLKESFGGIREGTVLRAIAASWVTDIPHTGWQDALEVILDARDALHRATGRAEDRLLLQEQDTVAELLGSPDADALLRDVYGAARSVAYAAETTWHRVGRLARRGPRLSLRPVRRRGADRLPLADGVVVQDGEVVLAAEARPDRDPVLLLRAAAAAAQAGLPLAPHAVRRLAAESAPLPRPWPRAAREAFVSLLGAGEPLIGIWESLDQAGLGEVLVPGWSVVRCAPQRNSLHRYTVDRHLLQTAVEASALTRDVERPDLLLVGALLHDIGKARPGDHSIVGAELAVGHAAMLGFDAQDVEVIRLLVRHHLLLAETATRRDLDDPATAQSVTEVIGSHEVLDLLNALTRADALATGPSVSSDWRRRLIDDLTARCHHLLAGRVVPVEPSLTHDRVQALAGDGLAVLLEPVDDAAVVTVAAPDRMGLLATAAGVLSLHRLQVRSARVATHGDRAIQEWTVHPLFGDPPSEQRLAEDLRLALDGSLDLEARLRAREEAYRPAAGETGALRARPRVDLVAAEGARATILEVRAHDEAGLLHRIASAVAAAGAGIAGAKVATLGSEVVDVFFLVDDHGRPLDDAHAASVQVTVLGSLTGQVP